MTTPVRDRHLAGLGRFVADVRLPDMAEMAVVRSQAAHGRIVALDTDRARAAPGVLAVLTADDLDPVPRIPIRAFATEGMERHLQPVLALDRTRYVGEPLAVVVARDRYTAEDAADLVEAELEPLPPIADVDGVPWGTDEPSAPAEVCRWRGADGDVQAAFARAALVLDERFRTQRHTGMPMETRGLLARWDADEPSLDLWGPTKLLGFTQRTVAGWFRLDPAQVRCHHVDVGGMFGVRGELYPEDFLVPWAARVVGRPVRWIEDRREHLLSINHGREGRYRFELAVSPEGRLSAFRCTAAVDMGAYARPAGGRVPLLVVEELPGPYAWDAFEATSVGILTNKTPVGTVRGPSAMESTFVRERAIDLAAERLRIDPMQLRRASLIDQEEPFLRRFGGSIHPQTYERPTFVRMFDRLVTALAPEETEPAAVTGAACFLAHSGLGEEEHVLARLDRDGHLVVVTSASDVGQGVEPMVEAVAQLALPLEAEDVEVRSGSTVDAPPGRGTFASRVTMFVGNATYEACQQLGQQARVRAAKDLGAPLEELVLTRGGVRWGEHLLRWRELGPLEAEALHRDQEPSFGFGLVLADVTLDAQTLAARVTRLAVGYDCGHAIDPPRLEGQLVGAAVQALGGTLLEELPYDDAGQLLGGTFMDYLLPTAAEAPPVRVAILEEGGPTNALRARGAGEAGVLGVGAAIANGVARALRDERGIPTALPLGPGQLFETIRAAT